MQHRVEITVSEVEAGAGSRFNARSITAGSKQEP